MHYENMRRRTRQEEDHAFWMDVLAEVRGAFASDAVWLTEFAPIHGYDLSPHK